MSWIQETCNDRNDQHITRTYNGPCMCTVSNTVQDEMDVVKKYRPVIGQILCLCNTGYLLSSTVEIGGPERGWFDRIGKN